jgi:hypothetical protein|tara:strand:+ start:272 stop:526 length:255 start_codon:yes stop_codon:yes gene_type:complete
VQKILSENVLRPLPLYITILQQHVFLGAVLGLFSFYLLQRLMQGLAKFYMQSIEINSSRILLRPAERGFADSSMEEYLRRLESA